MAERNRRGLSRAQVVLLGSVAAFVVLLLVVQPIGDALIDRGLSNRAFAALLTLVVLVLMAVPIAVWAVGRRRFIGELVASVKSRVEAWAASAGWRPANWRGGNPAVLDRIRLGSSELITAAAGDVAGLASTMTGWRQSFANRGSPVTATVVWLVLTTDGFPRDASAALGKFSGSGYLGKMPSRWAGLPPTSLVRVAPTHPWGTSRVAVWPGHAVPPPPAWSGVAQELDAMLGWLILHEGRLEIAVRLDREPIRPERLIAVSNEVIGLLGGRA
ncbi:MAG: hypothetical protein ACTH2Q_14745 [Propionibacteriaceae bacterium]